MSEVTAEHEALLAGKYRLVRLLAKGGMGTVYAAEELPEGRKVAVKLLNESSNNNPKAAQRLYTEAHAASSVGHPNIVEVFDLGQTYTGIPFLVMELLEGQSLADVLQLLGKLEAQYAIDIVSQLLSALSAAHEKGIVHRDLKPQNIFLCHSAAGPIKVKILDFGISKMWTDDNQLHLTQTGFVVGTPYYMSPEHARGAKDLDGQTDIWAVGVVLYQAITGQLPYEGETYNELLAKILNEPYPEPRQVAPWISPILERVMLKALAKEREDRYLTAAQFRSELLAVTKLTADPVVHTPKRATSTGGNRRFWRTAAILGLVMGTLALGTLTGLAVFSPGDVVDDTLGKQPTPVMPEPLHPMPQVGPGPTAPPSEAPETPALATERAETVELRVRVRPDSSRTRVLVNGQELDGGVVQVSPGVEHLIAISSPGFQPAQIRRSILTDTIIEVQLTPTRRSREARQSKSRPSRVKTTEPTTRERSTPLRNRRIELVEEYPQ